MPNRRDWLLAALEAAGENGLSPIQLQKSMFVLGRQINIIDEHGKPSNGDLETYYSFYAYDYGPFSKELYKDCEALAEQGAIVVTPDTGARKRFKIGPVGKASAVDNAVGARASYISELINWVQKMSFEDLLRSVYKKYPEMATNSVFRGRTL